jgi:hypothetical protein
MRLYDRTDERFQYNKEIPMTKSKWMIAAMVAVMAMGLAAGCSDSDDGGGSSDSYAGVWKGTVCGRGLTLNLSQNGTALSGSYTFTDPTFNDTCAGTVSSTTPAATVILKSTGGHDFWFNVTFTSYNTLSGGYYKSGLKVCDVNAVK